nr:leucine-rich repeat domain-containing protein [Acetatifactor sp.]
MKKLQARLSWMKKYLWSMAVFAMLFVLALYPIQAKASSGELTQEILKERLEALQVQFPDGRYWNHEGSSENNPEGTTDKPCHYHGGAGELPCNYVLGSRGYCYQCWGFAIVLSQKLYGQSFENWGYDSDYDDVELIKPGDVLQFGYLSGVHGPIPGHTAMVLGVSGDDIYVVDCNGDRNDWCVIRWNRKFSRDMVNTGINTGNYVFAINSCYSAPMALPYQEGYCGINATYVLQEDGTLIIRGTGGIYDRFFENNEEIKKVVIESGITTIGLQSFANCPNLEEVTLHNGLQNIYDRSFYESTALKKINVPANLKYLGTKAFYNCGISTFDLPQGLETIGTYVFLGCPSFSGNRSHYDVQNGVMRITGQGEIYKNLFKDQTDFNELVIGEGIQVIENNVFEGCSNLQKVTIPDSLLEIRKGAFMNSGVTAVTLPEGIQKLGDQCFYNCNYLGSVNLPESLKEIGDQAFSNCSLAQVELPTSLEKEGERIFEGCYGFCGNHARYEINGDELRISGTGDVYEYAFWGNRNIYRAYVGEGITKLGDHAFGYCSTLFEIEIPQSVCFLGAETFYYCQSLGYVYCHASPFTLEWESPIHPGETFKEYGWTRFYVPTGYLEFYKARFDEGQNVTFYGDDLGDEIDPNAVLLKGQCGYFAFYDLKYDGTLIIEGFGEIDANSFDARTNPMWQAVKTIVIKDKINGIGDEAFYGCSYVQTVTLPDSMAHVGAGAFTGCTELADVNCHADVDWFEGWDAFEGNEVHVHVYGQDMGDWTSHGGIQAPVAFIGDLETPVEAYDYRKGRCGIDAYYVIDEENTLTVTGSGQMVGIFSFDWTLKGGQDVVSFSGIQKVIVEEGITEIGEGSFYGMSSITEICLPESLETIGHNALILMRGLRKINLPEGLKKLEACTFEYCSALKTIDVPHGVQEIGEACFYGCTGIDEFTCRADPAVLTWMTNSRDKDFKTSTPKTVCHVPSNYLNGYLEKFGHVNVTFVGDLDPELRDLTFEEIKAKDASCTEDGTMACFLGSDGHYYLNEDGVQLTDQNGDGIVNQFDVILPATGHLHTEDSLIWRWEKAGEDFAVTACLKCMRCGTFEESVSATVVKTEGAAGVTYVATATLDGTQVSMTREIKNEYYVTIDGTSSTHAFGDRVTAWAAAPPEGMAFAGWYEGDALVCNSLEIDFLVSRNVALHTVYVDAAQYVEPEEPILNFDLSERVFDEAGNQKLDMTVTWYLSDGMSVKDVGLVRTTDEEAELTIDNEEVKKRSAGVDNQSGTFIHHLTLGEISGALTAYAKAYLVYDDAQGEEHVLYTDRQSSAPAVKADEAAAPLTEGTRSAVPAAEAEGTKDNVPAAEAEGMDA